MDTTRIKVKIGEYEFDAEGPVEAVQAQFESFKNMISTLPAKEITSAGMIQPQLLKTDSDSSDSTHVPIEKVMHVSGRVVSLTAIPASNMDAALLIMLGHKNLRNHISVTGQEIGDGLAQSGRPVPRVDRVMDKAIEDAYVLKTGIKRGTRYRLTNQGLAKALIVAAGLIASLP